ncbi:MAG TPA: hypothetical protein VMH39_02990, partial [Gemmatimonadaceae bacterium]|nr:hypothetical protein [Gemmatimonadaceae bacterium]
MDAMGGDFAPGATVSGALLALAELDAEHTILLVGPTDVIRRELNAQLVGEHAALTRLRDRVTIIDAPEVIEMTDK